MTAFPTAGHLRGWARGSYPDEAGVELLARAFAGKFTGDQYPWLRPAPPGGWFVDWDAITDESTAPLSGGERRLLALAASIGGDRVINLADSVAGLDRGIVQLVLAAIAHTGGAHEHSDPLTGGRLDSRRSRRHRRNQPPPGRPTAQTLKRRSEP